MIYAFIFFFTMMIQLIPSLTNIMTIDIPKPDNLKSDVVEDYLASVFTSELTAYMMPIMQDKQEMLYYGQLQEMMVVRYDELDGKHYGTCVVHRSIFLDDMMEEIRNIENIMLRKEIYQRFLILHDWIMSHDYMVRRAFIDVGDVEKAIRHAYKLSLITHRV